jgi:hypothetical protein
MSSLIDPTLAKSLIKEFQQQNSSADGPGLKTPDGPFLNGFFIDRKSLESILNSNPDIVGISVHLAKHPDFSGKPDNVFTILLNGAEPNPKPDSKTPYVRSGGIHKPPPPCPPWCCEL